MTSQQIEALVEASASKIVVYKPMGAQVGYVFHGIIRNKKPKCALALFVDGLEVDLSRADILDFWILSRINSPK